MFLVDPQAAEHGADFDLIIVAASVLERLQQAAIALQRFLSGLRIGELYLQAA